VQLATRFSPDSQGLDVGRDRFGQLRCRHRVNSRADHYPDLRGSQDFGSGFAVVDGFGHSAQRVEDGRPHAVTVLQHNLDGVRVKDIQLC
jgi:hypothetical protein